MVCILETSARPISTAAQEASAALSSLPERRFPPLAVANTGKVRLGAQGPCFRASAIADSGKVRLGAQGPIFR